MLIGFIARHSKHRCHGKARTPEPHEGGSGVRSAGFSERQIYCVWKVTGIWIQTATCWSRFSAGLNCATSRMTVSAT